MQTLPKCCDVLVKHKKAPAPPKLGAPKKEGAEGAEKEVKAADEDQERKAALLKPQNLKEALGSSKIQLKQEVVDQINANSKKGVGEEQEESEGLEA